MPCGPMNRQLSELVRFAGENDKSLLIHCSVHPERSSPMTETSTPEIIVRKAAAEDAAVCGQICYDAFAAINAAHGFPCDFPGPEAPVGLLTRMFANPACYCVVAEVEGRVVGSNCLLEGSTIDGIGPITIQPGTQNRGVGRKLMEDAMRHAETRGAVGVRLVQAAFHNRSFSLYTSLGFDVREPLACLQGTTRERNIPGCQARAATQADEKACNGLARRVHGFERAGELAQGIAHETARVVERGGRITAYTTHLGFFGHSTAETNVDMQALIASAESLAGSGILVPSRNSVLLRWCLENGLRVVQPMTLMSTGLYNEPAGAWLPSVLF
jgi:GNAT superfamily N-acetyltransferase